MRLELLFKRFISVVVAIVILARLELLSTRNMGLLSALLRCPVNKLLLLLFGRSIPRSPIRLESGNNIEGDTDGIVDMDGMLNANRAEWSDDI